MYLNDIFPNYITEDTQYECKTRLNRNDVLRWIITIDGFANTKGGILFIGVEDKTYKVIGFYVNELDKEKLYFYHTLKEHFDILPQINTSVLSYAINEKNKIYFKN